MRFLIILPILLMASCNSDLSTDGEKQACRDGGTAEGSQMYKNCIERASNRRARFLERDTSQDLSQ